MAAKSAAELTVKNVAVIPSRTIPQGLAAMLRLIPDGDFNLVVEEMNQALDEVHSGEITTAIRNVEVDNVEVQEGQIIALLDGKLVSSAHSLEKAGFELLDEVEADQYELVTLFYGADISKQDANQIADAIQAEYPNLEVELQNGGQPHYQFILSIE